jgi:hypothetical protein
MNDDLNCPYCDASLEVNHDDGFGYDQDRAHEMQCDECKKYFIFHTHIHFSYHPEKADCLNGTPHNFSKWYELWRQNDNIAKTLTITEAHRCRDCEFEERRGRIQTKQINE